MEFLGDLAFPSLSAASDVSASSSSHAGNYDNLLASATSGTSNPQGRYQQQPLSAHSSGTFQVQMQLGGSGGGGQLGHLSMASLDGHDGAQRWQGDQSAAGSGGRRVEGAPAGPSSRPSTPNGISTASLATPNSMNVTGQQGPPNASAQQAAVLQRVSSGNSAAMAQGAIAAGAAAAALPGQAGGAEGEEDVRKRREMVDAHHQRGVALRKASWGLDLCSLFMGLLGW